MTQLLQKCMDILTVVRSQYNPVSGTDTCHVEMLDMDGISIIDNITLYNYTQQGLSHFVS